MKTGPKRLFRVHRRGRDAYVGRDPLPSVEAWVEANRPRFRPGQVARVVVAHDPDCRYPAGRPCTCKDGPAIRLEGEDPASN
jgi:hypothetical protein